MPRKIIVQTNEGVAPVLQEVKAEDEFQLQELVKDNPDLLPIEEFGMTGPLLVVGRETTLPSGAVDLVALTRSWELLIIEFKTGPQNTDFRHAFSQLLDYGSDLWTMSVDDFETTVPTRYFAGSYCSDSRVRGLKSLDQAARITWNGIPDEEIQVMRERLAQQLESGIFHYVLVAQRFTNTVERTVEYLNHAMSGARFYAVELVRFQGDGMSAFESRTILKPSPRQPAHAPISITENKLLEAIVDGNFKAAVGRLLEACRGLGYRFEWGTSGVSIRLPSPDKSEPLTIAWLFPYEVSGWMGLRNLNLGFDRWSANQHPSIQQQVEEYLGSVGALPGAEPAKAKNLKDTVYALSPQAAVQNEASIAEILATLINAVSSPEP